MRIALDLDNTLIDYDDAFRTAAAAFGVELDATAGKHAVRAAMRALPDGERQWMRLQARVYGPEIGRARLFAGAEAFIASARARGVALTIVSHKTELAAAAPDGPNLRACARDFLRAQGIDVPLEFAATRAEKCRRLGELGVTHAIDDLVEVFADPAFPRAVARWLLAPRGGRPTDAVDRVFASWDELREALDA